VIRVPVTPENKIMMRLFTAFHGDRFYNKATFFYRSLLGENVKEA
jgi:hypothetical protein